MILEYNTILGETESTTVIEHSKFICNLKRIENEEEAKEFISLIKKRHSLANHHCYAYIADENGLTSLTGVFAGGDAVTGAATVISAMGAGKIAAESIDDYIKNKKEK